MLLLLIFVSLSVLPETVSIKRNGTQCLRKGSDPPSGPHLHGALSSRHETYVPSPQAPRSALTLTPSSQYTPTRSSPREFHSPTGRQSPTHPHAHPTPPHSLLPNRLNSRQSLRDQAVRDICGTEIFGSRLQPARTPFDSTIAIELPDIPEQYRGASEFRRCQTLSVSWHLQCA